MMKISIINFLYAWGWLYARRNVLAIIQKTWEKMTFLFASIFALNESVMGGGVV